MEQALQCLGLNQKESKFYLYLLHEGAFTAAVLATELKESRTNTYMILDRLVEQGLVVADDTKAVKKYQADNPVKLRNLLVRQQDSLKQGQQALAGVLPQLSSIYRVGQHRPGVAYFEGVEGYKAFQNAVAQSEPPIDIFASNVVPENKAAWEALQAVVSKRVARRTPARMIFHTDAKNWLDVPAFEANGYEIRFWGEEPLVGEFVIFGDNLGLTSYLPEVVTTVVTNQVIASTFGTIFEQIWQQAELPAS